MLKYTEYNLDRKRDLSRAHSASAQAKKAAAAKRKAEQLSQGEEGPSSGQQPEAKSPKSAKLEVIFYIPILKITTLKCRPCRCK